MLEKKIELFQTIFSKHKLDVLTKMCLRPYNGIQAWNNYFRQTPYILNSENRTTVKHSMNMILKKKRKNEKWLQKETFSAARRRFWNQMRTGKHLFSKKYLNNNKRKESFKGTICQKCTNIFSFVNFSTKMIIFYQNW